MRTLACSVIVIATVVALLAQGSPLDYTQWRGQDRDGSASAFSEPRTWPDQLTRRWKVEVGEGYATPILSASAVYVFTRRDGNEGITALDAETGRERWRSSYAAPYTPSQPAAAHDREQLVVLVVLGAQRLDPEEQVVVVQRQPLAAAP